MIQPRLARSGSRPGEVVKGCWVSVVLVIAIPPDGRSVGPQWVSNIF
jgi:hypothetical protein